MVNRPHTKETELDIANRRAKAADMTLDGYTQREIAAELGVSLGCVNGDVKAVLEDWQAEARGKLGQHKQKELRRLDKVIRRAVEGWHRSCETEVIVQKTEGERETPGEAGKPNGKTKESKTVATRRPQAGDPAFLAQIQAAVAKRVKILGLESAYAMGDDNGDEPTSEPDRILRVSDVLSGILHASPALVARIGGNGKQVDPSEPDAKTNGVPKSRL